MPINNKDFVEVKNEGWTRIVRLSSIDAVKPVHHVGDTGEIWVRGEVMEADDETVENVRKLLCIENQENVKG